MSDAELYQRAAALFLELRVLSRSERGDALAAVAADDPRLAAEAASLLEHDVADALPARIGPYRIVARVGRGGSGQVFLAEQEEPLRRRVAVKVVPQAAVSAEAAARFEIERRVLERTDHPNITRVLDAGRTPDGLPYLVMNFVEGEAITDYCVRHAVPLADRIRLMLDVADAVQHAHQRGVIHRDLKPANILVTEIDGRCIPQVLDFGIAKPVAGAFAGDAPQTLGLPMGTPAYMAPEQTGVGPVDTRADVYALGAVLYELVGGVPPMDVRGDFRGDARDDVEGDLDPLERLRRIREDVPAPASRVRAERRSRGAPGLSTRSFLADLDVILDKALEKSPSRRYASVGALIDDLRALLACQPIAARPPTLRYRTVRFAQRNRALVASLAVVLAALFVGLVGLAAGLFEARRQALEAGRQGLEARRQALEAQNQSEAQREINRFLTEDLLGAAEADREGADVTVLELLNRAGRRIDQRFPAQPFVAAAVHHALGEAYAELGSFDDAERHLEQAVEMRRSAAGVDAPDTVRSEIAAASLLGLRERLQEAEAALVPAIERARRILGPDDEALYAALNDLGVVFLTLGRNEQALALLTEALDGRRRVLGKDAPLVAITPSNLAQVLDQQGDSAASLATMREALRIVESSPDPPRMIVLGLHNNIGATLQDLDRNEEAAPYLRRAAELADDLLGPDHPATLTIEANLAGLESDVGEPERAMDAYLRLIEKRTTQLGAAASDTLTARYGYWNAMWKAGRFEEAASGFAELLADVAAALGEDHWLTAQTECSLGRALFDGGHADEALPHAERAEERLRTLFGADHSRTLAASQVIEAIRGSAARPDR